MSVDWTPRTDEISVRARGFQAGRLAILAGPATGPHARRDAPRVWSTAGTPVPSARARFDATGEATVTIRIADLPDAQPLLLQAVAISDDAAGRPLAVSPCMVLRRDAGQVEIVPHAIEVLRSPVTARMILLAAVALACVLLTRVRVGAAPARPWRLVVPMLLAAYLVLCRAAAPASEPRTLKAVPTPLLADEVPVDQRPLDPVDRVAVPGFRALVEAVTAHGRPDAPIAIVPASESGPSQRDAWQAAWMVWPRRARIEQPGGQAAERRGLYLILGDPALAGTETDDALFRNGAGSLRSFGEQPR